ncbi:DUF4149 domain-containing protein [Helicobacter sp. 23-1048]
MTINATKIVKFLDSLYLLLLGIGVGAIIACIFSAPTLFRAGEILTLPITKEQSGVLMGRIFENLNIVLFIVAGGVIVFEFIVAKMLRNSSIVIVLSAGISLIMIFLFALYYTPYILSAPDAQSPEFQSMHAQSVVVFDILLVSLCVLFVSKFLKIVQR